MAVSGYQILRLVTRMRRERADESLADQPLDAVPAANIDRVRLSEKAREQSEQVAQMLRLPPGTPVAVATIVEYFVHVGDLSNICINPTQYRIIFD